MSDNNEGLLSEWEWSVIKNATPAELRKRFREELDEINRAGSILDIVGDNHLLARVLAYAWKSTYCLALVCKRFHAIVQGRTYWQALAKHALRTKVPAVILEQINFFYGLESTDPPHYYLQGFLKRNDCNIYEGSCIELHHHPGNQCVEIHWAEKKSAKDNVFYLCFFQKKDGEIVPETDMITVHYNHPYRRVLVQSSMSKRVGWRRLHYCEVYDEESGKTWCGQPKTREKHEDSGIAKSDLLPGPHEFGVWK